MFPHHRHTDVLEEGVRVIGAVVVAVEKALMSNRDSAR